MDNQQPSNNDIFFKIPKKGFGFIYKYTSPSKHSYIGQTIQSLNQRAHTAYNGLGYKKCKVFWQAIQKYGWSNFKVEILEEVPIQILNEREEFYIKHYNTLAPNGYNICNTADCGKKQEVYVYSAQNGKFLEHYNSVTTASQETGIPVETISAILNNDRTKGKNHRIAHNLTFTKTYVECVDTSHSPRSGTNVIAYDNKNNFIGEYCSIKEAARQTGISSYIIGKMLRGEGTRCKKYIFVEGSTTKSE